MEENDKKFIIILIIIVIMVIGIVGFLIWGFSNSNNENLPTEPQIKEESMLTGSKYVSEEVKGYRINTSEKVKETKYFENLEIKISQLSSIDNRTTFLGTIKNTGSEKYEGADIVLVSHNIVTSMDPDYPASLSKNVHDILRNVLDFDGVIVTDDLYMDAIKEYQDNVEVAVTAVLAGNDLICTTDFETQISAVIEAVKNGTISESAINASVKRILNLKSELNLI